MGRHTYVLYKAKLYLYFNKKIMVAGVAWLGREFVKGERGFGDDRNW